MKHAVIAVGAAVALAIFVYAPAGARPPSRSSRWPALPRPTLVPPRIWEPPVPDAATAPDGACVIVLHDARLPLVHVMVTVAAGSALDPPSRPGLAAAVLSMLQDGGAGERDARQLADAFADLGTELHESIDPDQVTLELTVLARNLPRALELVGDVLARPRFDAVEWQRLQARRIAEIARRRADRADLADDTLLRTLYGDHPYAHAPLGDATSIGGITVAELRAFHRAHYGPRALAFIAVGDTDAKTAMQAVTHALGDWKPPVMPPPPPPAPSPPSPRLVIVDQPGAPQSELRVGWLGRPRDTPDFPSLMLLRMALGGSFTSRLNQDLRERHGYTYGAQAHFDFWRAAGPFRAMAAVRSDTTAAALRETLRELDGMRAPLGAAELDKTRALTESAIVDAFSDGELTCGYVADLLTHALPLEAWNTFLADLRRLDAAAVAEVARREFAPRPLAVVIVGDAKRVEPALRAFGLPIEHRDADGKLLP